MAFVRDDDDPNEKKSNANPPRRGDEAQDKKNEERRSRVNIFLAGKARGGVEIVFDRLFFGGGFKKVVKKGLNRSRSWEGGGLGWNFDRPKCTLPKILSITGGVKKEVDPKSALTGTPDYFTSSSIEVLSTCVGKSHGCPGH